MCLHMLLNRGNNMTVDMFQSMKNGGFFLFFFISAPLKSKLSANFLKF